MKQAVFLAIIFETSGAILMGSHVSETNKGIADYRCFESQPELLMYGCMWVVLSVGLWLFLASYLEMPASMITFMCRRNDWNGMGTWWI